MYDMYGKHRIGYLIYDMYGKHRMGYLNVRMNRLVKYLNDSFISTKSIAVANIPYFESFLPNLQFQNIGGIPRNACGASRYFFYKVSKVYDGTVIRGTAVGHVVPLKVKKL